MDILQTIQENQTVIYITTAAGALGIFIAKQMAARFSDDLYNFIKYRIFKRPRPNTRTPTGFPEHHQQGGVIIAPQTTPVPQGHAVGPVTASVPMPPQAPSIGQPAQGEFVVTTTRARYTMQRVIAKGDVATIFTGVSSDASSGPVLLKLADRPGDADFMQAESRILGILWDGAGQYEKHLPRLIEEIRTPDGRVGHVFERIDGYDLYAVRAKYPNGVPQEHIIWIFRRTLAALGYAHSRGVLHGNLDPSHIMIRPSDHNVWLVDWCYSIFEPAQTGQTFRAHNDKFSAPEVAERKPPLPSSDLYSAGKCMIFALGGDPATNAMPSNVDERIQRFIQFFVRPSAIQRAQDAWEMYGKLDKLREEVFGAHQFREFRM